MVITVVFGWWLTEDIGDRSTHIGEIGASESSDVVEESTRRELAAQHDPSADGECRTPARHEGIAVEERHGAVADFIGGDAVDRARPYCSDGHALVGAHHRLGSARRSRSEQEEEGAVTVGVGGRTRRFGVGTKQIVVRRRFDVETATRIDTEIESVQELEATRVTHDQLAVGMAHVAFEFGTATRGVDAHDAGAHHGCSTDPEQVLGNVLEKYPDVGWKVGVETLLDDGRTNRRLVHDLRPRPRRFAEDVSDVRVVGAGA